MVQRLPKLNVYLWYLALDGFLLFHSCFLNPCKFSTSTKLCAKDFTALSLLQEGSWLCICSGHTTCQFNFLFHSSIFIFTFNHSDFMKGYCKMLSAIKTNKLCDSLFKWTSSGISLTKVNFTSFSFTEHYNFYPPDHKWTTTLLSTVPTSFHRNHPGFSGSFQAAVIWFYFVTPSIAGLMLWLTKAS